MLGPLRQEVRNAVEIKATNHESEMGGTSIKNGTLKNA
jgi:hypothetical protein